MKREHGSLDGQRRAPLVLQDVKANGARLARNIGMPHFRQKLALWRLKRVPVWNHNVDLIRMHLLVEFNARFSKGIPYDRVQLTLHIYFAKFAVNNDAPCRRLLHMEFLQGR